MSMPLGSINDLVAVIRGQLSARASDPSAAARQVRSERPLRTTKSRYAQENLASLIELRITQIDKDDPQRGRKAFRVFLEAVLLSHLGENLVNDPKFFQIVDEVQQALEADRGCAELVANAINHLLSVKT